MKNSFVLYDEFKESKNLIQKRHVRIYGNALIPYLIESDLNFRKKIKRNLGISQLINYKSRVSVTHYFIILCYIFVTGYSTSTRP